MYELAEYLTRRHPNMYSVTRHPLPRHEHGNAWQDHKDHHHPLEDIHDLDTEEPLKVARML